MEVLSLTQYAIPPHTVIPAEEGLKDRLEAVLCRDKTSGI